MTVIVITTVILLEIVVIMAVLAIPAITLQLDWLVKLLLVVACIYLIALGILIIPILTML
ncbi:MAG TPA: hypothetical protein DGR27_05125 [Eubacterium sp.]|nr:MAG TPA: hypothetical protein [Caudoviricetes sp.]HAS70620.1 hypothetical protein [Eubacterium sp.]HCW37882.1 hypothetical protein [Eubacterium sp.]